jgi:hypothetical protein
MGGISREEMTVRLKDLISDDCYLMQEDRIVQTDSLRQEQVVWIHKRLYGGCLMICLQGSLQEKIGSCWIGKRLDREG